MPGKRRPAETAGGGRVHANGIKESERVLWLLFTPLVPVSAAPGLVYAVHLFHPRHALVNKIWRLVLAGRLVPIAHEPLPRSYIYIFLHLRWTTSSGSVGLARSRCLFSFLEIG
ncbi:hypothetical protein GQ53DRAFT_754933 [Thozetella sp. PMI_491]|nr:hypothetical protein GQ53DRAFT_754933 [Thozetella sp. PMI_491]